MTKKTWNQPTLESLDVSATMAGVGSQYIDWTYVGGQLDLDVTDDPSSGIPVPQIPGLPVS
ncbi:paeninodin family lasso peptide [Paenibacillus tarimensis]|uniref:paeninodin family lasso peptide n=1 Tax=Paenibacillus tarimensis TaxID=416012 RepID=UPI001F44BAE8|nr:paeninodin family lasso peptide [Paenibacillus tarimensis]MCF2944247.1 paeninodin family lasso peptide [Paenibacillus tarimensis]